MNKKSVLGLLLFSSIVITGMFFGTMLMIRQGSETNNNQFQQELGSEVDESSKSTNQVSDNSNLDNAIDIVSEDEWFYTDSINDNSNIEDFTQVQDNEEINSYEDSDNSNENGDSVIDDTEENTEENTSTEDNINTEENTNTNPDGLDGSVNHANSDTINSQDTNQTEEALGGSIVELPDMQLIYDCNKVDYMAYIPEMVFDSKIEIALDISNPSLDINAKSAILFDANTREVLYYKDPVEPVFPASTSKLLTALLALDWCMEEEEVTVGDELDLVASDSTLARIKKGQVLTIRNLIEGMLVPSGNDAAYVVAAYVGRKSLGDENASLKEAIPEFIRLMNNKAKSLGAINSCFKTPDGYDAIGQYTTAYDMGMIGLAAASNDTIVEVCNKTRARNIFVDGYDVTWNTTNSLIKKDSGRYYPYCMGLKTGTSTMAGRCLISFAKKDGKEVVSVVMNSDTTGRWEDSIKLLNYGLGN